jgi:hypothetical protein
MYVDPSVATIVAGEANILAAATQRPASSARTATASTPSRATSWERAPAKRTW